MHEAVVAHKFARQARREHPPDVIVSAWPSVDLATAAVRYGLWANVPTILDVRDLWPDIFRPHINRYLRPFSNYLLYPFNRKVRFAFSHAAGISGITAPFVDWGVKRAGRPKGPFDRDFPLAYPDTTPTETAQHAARAFWDTLGLRNRFVVCFLGNLGQQHSIELEAVFEAARRLLPIQPDVLFVLGGGGVNLDRYRRLAADCTNVLFPGRIAYPEVWTLLRLSSIGLVPYESLPDFMMSIPNKAIEYLSAGLPVLSSVRGTLQELLAREHSGLTYSNNNPKMLAEQVLWLRNNPESRESMSRQALRLYKERFVARNVYSAMAEYVIQCSEKAKLGTK
jgi:glycosyltransferase involved in cell wall biosynthesis